MSSQCQRTVGTSITAVAFSLRSIRMARAIVLGLTAGDGASFPGGLAVDIGHSELPPFLRPALDEVLDADAVRPRGAKTDAGPVIEPAPPVLRVSRGQFRLRRGKRPTGAFPPTSRHQVRATRVPFTDQPASRRRTAIRRWPERPSRRASATMSAVGASSPPGLVAPGGSSRAMPAERASGAAFRDGKPPAGHDRPRRGGGRGPGGGAGAELRFPRRSAPGLTPQDQLPEHGGPTRPFRAARPPSPAPSAA